MAIVNSLAVGEATTTRINDELRSFGLAGFENTIPSWDSHPRAFEVVEIQNIDMDNNPKFAIVTFVVLTPPRGEIGVFSVKVSKNSLLSHGIVIIARINNKYVLTRQHRMPVSDRELELPRCFPGKLDDLINVRSPSLLQIPGIPLRCAVDEIGKEVVRASHVKSSKHVCRFPEDTGYSMMQPDAWYFNVHADKQVLAQRRVGPNEMGLEIRLLSLRELVEALLSHQIKDAHSVTALTNFFIEANLLPALLNPSEADSLQINWRS